MSNAQRLSLILLLSGLTLTAGCTKRYTLQLEGQVPPGSQVRVSHWAQEGREVVPVQQEGTAVAADAQGRFQVASASTFRSRWFSMPGPPPFLTLEVLDPATVPLCVTFPTRGLWEQTKTRLVALPPVRPLTSDELTYQLEAAPLPGPLEVVRRDPAAPGCVKR